MPTWTQEQLNEYQARRARACKNLSQTEQSIQEVLDSGIGNSMIKTKCQTCGIEFDSFPSSRRKYCSLKCAYASSDRVKHVHKKDRGTRVCKNCSNIFEVHTTAAKAVFCCQRCAASYIGRRTILKNRMQAKRTKYVDHICASCGRSFKAWEANKRLYCSSKCAGPPVNKKAIETRRSKGTFLNDNTYSRCKRGWREIAGRRVFFRSRWESNYGRYLQLLKDSSSIREWEHEPDTFWFKGIRRGCLSYLPDFKVTNPDGSVEYHEVKGWMDRKSKTKINRMEKYYPGVRIRLIDSSWFKVNGKKLRAIVPGWER